MNSSTPTGGNRGSRKIIEIAIRLLALGFLLYWSINILEPFAEILVWSIIFAVSLYPFYMSLSRRMGGRKRWPAIFISFGLLLLIVFPAVWMITATTNNIISFSDRVKQEGVVINPPPQNVKNIPLVGKKIDQLWTKASTNFDEFAEENSEKVKSIMLGILGLVSSTAKGILFLAAAIIVSGFLLYYGKQTGRFTKKFFSRMAGKEGENMVRIAEVTIRSVTRGILGVAAIQTLVAGTGMVIGGVPLAGVWTLLWLVLAIIQVPRLPLALGIIIWAWSSNTLTSMAILLTVWMILASLLDNILKPILLGKGAPVPTIVVFLGAIGGLIFRGFSGLFTGAIVLSLTYKLIEEWVSDAEVDEQ